MTSVLDSGLGSSIHHSHCILGQDSLHTLCQKFNENFWTVTADPTNCHKREAKGICRQSFCTLFQLNLRSCDGSFLSRDRVGSKKFLFSLWLCHSCYDRYSGAETSTIWNQLHSKLWNISLHSFIDIMLWDRAQSIFDKRDITWPNNKIAIGALKNISWVSAANK